MKKIIAFIAALAATALLMSFQVYAERDIKMFASARERSSIQANMYDDSAAYGFLFGTADVAFDFEYAMPVYYISGYDKEHIPDSLSDIMIFSERFKVPVYDLKSNFLGFAEFGQIQATDELAEELRNDPAEMKKSTEHSGEWEIKSFSEGAFDDNLIEIITRDRQLSSDMSHSYDKVYYVELFTLNKSGLLYTSDSMSEERFFSVSDVYYSKMRADYNESDLYFSGSEILSRLISITDNAYGSGGIWEDGNADSADYEEIEETVEYVSDEEQEDYIIQDVTPVEDWESVDIQPEQTDEMTGDISDGKEALPKNGNAGIHTILSLLGIAGMCFWGSKRDNK